MSVQLRVLQQGTYSRRASGQMLIPWLVFPGWLQALAVGSIHLRHQSVVVVTTLVDYRDLVDGQWVVSAAPERTFFMKE